MTANGTGSPRIAGERRQTQRDVRRLTRCRCDRSVRRCILVAWLLGLCHPRRILPSPCAPLWRRTTPSRSRCARGPSFARSRTARQGRWSRCSSPAAPPGSWSALPVPRRRAGSGCGRGGPADPRPAAHRGLPLARSRRRSGHRAVVDGTRLDRYHEPLPAPPRNRRGPGRLGPSDEPGHTGGTRETPAAESQE